MSNSFAGTPYSRCLEEDQVYGENRLYSVLNVINSRILTTALELTSKRIEGVAMEQQLGQISLVVSDYDEAIAYFTQKLNFELVEDTPQQGKRWVIVRPPGSQSASLLLARAKNALEETRVGNQTGGRVAFFLYTDDFWRDYNSMNKAGIDFIGEPREEDYGYVIVFRDLYGNKWDFIQPRKGGVQ